MKKLLLLMGMLSVSLLAQAQSKAVDAFHRRHKGEDEALSFQMNGSLLRLLMWVDGDENDRELKEFAKGVDRMKILKMPGQDKSMILREFRNLKEAVRRESFEELMTVRSDNSHVDILVKGKGDWINELLLLVNDEDDFVMLDFRGKMDLNQVFDIANDVKIRD